jgi:transposase
MGQNFVTGERDQLFLLPPDARQWLPGRHLAWAVLEAAGELDLAPFTAGYRADGQGRPAYHPRLMVGLVMYCYGKGIRSSRGIEVATFDDVGARVICGNLHPDHATVARFVTRHEGPVKGLLVASLVACAKQGLVSVDVVAGDGTKVKASASMTANATGGQLETGIGELEALLAAEVDAWFAAARAADAAEDALFGEGGEDGGPGGGGGPGTLARLTDKIVRRRKAKARLDEEERARQQQAAAEREEKLAKAAARVARARQRAAREQAACQAKVDGYARRAAEKAASGRRKRPDGRAPVPPDRHIAVRRARRALTTAEQALAAAKAAPASAPPPAKPPKANTTDPASQVMPTKKGGFDQLCNVQVVAGAHQVILSIGTHDNPTDVQALHPALAQAQAQANLHAARISEQISKALFDAGYASDDNFTTGCEAELYVAVTKEARQAGRLRDGKQPATMKQSWQQMAARLDTPAGKTLYRQRSAIIEPVFAQLFHRLGRNLNYRDTKTDLELHLWAASHNFLKSIRHQLRASTQPAPASTNRPQRQTPASLTHQLTPTADMRQAPVQDRLSGSWN